jgi:hypothetical protein
MVMTAQVEPAPAPLLVVPRAGARARRALRIATACWFAVFVVGQWAFLWYLGGFYVRAVVTNHIDQWNRNHSIYRGYIAGDPAWNRSFGAHVVLAAILAFGGVLQLTPRLRTRAAWIHRWNGRAFLVCAIGGALGGLWMTEVRHIGVSGKNSLGEIAICLNATLILAFAALTWRTMRTGKPAAHRRWALRLLMVTNGVWFLRLGLYGWHLLTGGLGVGDNLDGPVAFAFDYASYLLPLAVLELYLRAAAAGPRHKLIAVGVLLAVTAYMVVGIFALTAAHLPLLR